MLRVTLHLLKKFQKLPAGCGDAVVMSIACHVDDPGSISLGVACHRVLFTLFYLMKKFLTASH